MVPRRRATSPWRRFAIRLLLVCVLGVLAGAGWLVAKPPVQQQLTSYGSPIGNAAAVLRQAERAMAAEVVARHGVKAADSRCYFTSPTASSGGELPVPVGNTLFCGPVLFVDGDVARPFLTFQLRPANGSDGRQQLALDDVEGDTDAANPGPAVDLVRPDGKQLSAQQLSPPRPPAARGDVLTTASTLPSPLTAAGPSARLVGQLAGVRLVEYGFVPSYGWGDRARSAPPGYRLLAFAVDPMAGELDDQQPDLSVRVDGQERGPLTATSDYLVTAVPLHARAVDLVLTDGGVKQSISLLTGQPDPANPAVTARLHTAQPLSATRQVKVRLKTATGSGLLDGTLTVRSLSLTFWSANGIACPGPDRAWLHVAATLQLDGDRQAYGAEAGLISVNLPAAGRLPARNAAADPGTQVDDVVDVPASITEGSLTYAGTVRTAKGTITVLTPVTVAFSIPAG